MTYTYIDYSIDVTMKGTKIATENSTIIRTFFLTCQDMDLMDDDKTAFIKNVKEMAYKHDSWGYEITKIEWFGRDGMELYHGIVWEED